MDLRETFQVFDKDEDGFLNAADLRLVLFYLCLLSFITLTDHFSLLVLIL